MTVHVHKQNNTWKNFLCNVKHSYYARIFLSATRKHSKAVVRAYKESAGYKCCVQELRYKSLGGLTGSQLNLIWRGADSYKQFQPGIRRLDNRSLTIFLEPVARLAAQASLEKYKQDFLWRPHIYEMPFSWNFLQEQIWVETSSVFIKDKLIIRELGKK